MPNTAFVICGGARTFLDCFDTCFKNVISRLCPDLSQVTLLFYMKLTDPGPKRQTNFDFEYKDTNYDETLAKIGEYRALGIKVYHKILFHSEINDIDLMESVKTRELYTGFNEQNEHFIRALHIAYNLERAGQILLDIEKERGAEFDTVVYIRPDLFFTGEAGHLSDYVLNEAIFCTGTSYYSYDHFAILPRAYMKKFFLDKMEIYRTNTEKEFVTPEHMYTHTVPHRIEMIAKYYIKREGDMPTAP